MHFRNYRETICCITVLTTAGRRTSAPTLKALPPPPSFHCPQCRHVGSLHASSPFPFLCLGRELLSIGWFVLKFYRLKSFYRVLQRREGDPVRAPHGGTAHCAPHRWPHCRHRAGLRLHAAPATPWPLGWALAAPWPLGWAPAAPWPPLRGEGELPAFFSFLNMSSERCSQPL